MWCVKRKEKEKIKREKEKKKPERKQRDIAEKLAEELAGISRERKSDLEIEELVKKYYREIGEQIDKNISKENDGEIGGELQ